MICPFNWAAVSVDDINQGVPVDYGLNGPAALMQLRTSSDTGFSMSSLDESNAFSYVEVPEWWTRWQSAPAIRADRLPRHLWEGRFMAHEMLRPGYRRLAMGGTHAVFLLLVINRRAVEQAANRLRTEIRLQVINDPSVFRAGVRLEGNQVVIYIHVDDFGVFACMARLSDRAALAVKAVLESWGFRVTFKPAGEVDLYLGLIPCHRPARFEPSRERLVQLWCALEEARRSRSLAPRAVAALVAHYVHYALLWRPGLSVVSVAYRFAQLEYPSTPWPTLIDEFALMQGMLGFLVGQIETYTIPLAGATDASGPTGPGGLTPAGAFCVSFGAPPVAELDALSLRFELKSRSAAAVEHRHLERHLQTATEHSPPGVRAALRSVLGAEAEGDELPAAAAARMRASTEASSGPYAVDGLAGVVPRGSDGALVRPTLYRSAMPSSWLHAEADWRPVLARRWHWPEHISRGEMKAPLVALRVLIGAVIRLRLLPWKWVAVNMVDNMGASSGWTRGRSSRWDLNRTLRQRAALAAAYGVDLAVGWMDTHGMPSDGGTRADEQGHLRLLRPQWMTDPVVVVICWGPTTAAEHLRVTSPVRVVVWESAAGATGDLSAAKNRGRLFALLSSGHVQLCWWANRGARRDSKDIQTSSASRSPSICLTSITTSITTSTITSTTPSSTNHHPDGEEVHWRACCQGMCILHDRGGYSLVEGWADDSYWKEGDMLGTIVYTIATTTIIRCALDSGIGWRAHRVLGTRSCTERLLRSPYRNLSYRHGVRDFEHSLAVGASALVGGGADLGGGTED